MSTSQPPALPPLYQIVQQDKTWLQKHERLILGTVTLAVVLFLGNKFLVKSAADATSKAAAAQQALALVEKQAADQAAAAQQTIAQLQAQEGATKQAMTRLAQTQASTEAALAALEAKIHADNTPIAAGQDFGNAYGVDMNGTPVTADNRLALTVPQVQAATIAKVQLDSLKKEDAAKDGAITQLQNENKIQDTLIGQQQTQLGTCKNEEAAIQKKADADVAAVKAQDRVSKRNWFLRGMATGAGMVGAILLHTHGVI